MTSRSCFDATILVAVLVALSGCSSDLEELDAPCNALVNDGPEVTPTEVEMLTTPAGGTIEDGTYVQTSYEYSVDPGAVVVGGPDTYRGLIEFSDGTMQAVVARGAGDQEVVSRFTAAYAASGTDLTLSYGCPDDRTVEEPPFTATPTEVHLFYRIADDNATAEIVFTKR